MLRLIHLLCACLAVWALAAAADSGDIQSASRSVVRIAVFTSSPDGQSFAGHGSGIVVAPNMILTNAHVVADPSFDEDTSFIVIPSEGKTNHPAHVVKVASGSDLALVQLDDDARLPAASLFTGKVADGADVFAIGYPGSVDVALQQADADTLHPQAPIKTRGTVSAGRSGKDVDTLLHTAPIAPGNSGGPLTDSCGRVVGVNSFGSTSEGGGASFYFAVSIREVMAFLRANQVSFRTDDQICKSAIDRSLDQAKSEAKSRIKVETEQRIAAELKSNEEGKVRRAAEFAIMTERDTGMALSGMLMLLSLVAAGATYIGFDRNKRAPMVIAAAVMTVLILLAAYVFNARPGFDQVDARVRASLAQSAVAGP
jgi:S1-C subfamily serine protease